MRRRRHRFYPGAELLETKASTSAMTPRAVPEISALAMPNRPAVAGALGGNYVSSGGDRRPADAPLSVRLHGAGTLSGMGRVSLSGALNFGGFLPAGRPDISGTVTLTTTAGSVTLRLTDTGGNGEIPGHRFVLNATIVSGTRAYANVRGIGTVTAQFGVNVIRCITTPCPIGGALTLTVNLRPPIR